MRLALGMVYLETLIFGQICTLYAIWKAHKKLDERILQFIEEVGEIDITPIMETNAEAMEMEMLAAKQAQIFDFINSFVQPNNRVQEITKSDDKGRIL